MLNRLICFCAIFLGSVVFTYAATEEDEAALVQISNPGKPLVPCEGALSHERKAEECLGKLQSRKNTTLVFEKLPLSILGLVFGKLDLQTRLTGVLCACKSFRAVLELPHIWDILVTLKHQHLSGVKFPLRNLKVITGTPPATEIDGKCFLGFEHLRSLNLKGCPQVGNDLLLSLGGLKHLTHLGLRSPLITDEGVSALGSHPTLPETLQQFELQHAAITDASLRVVALFRNLRDLSLWKTPITPNGIPFLNPLATKLVRLDLAGTKTNNTSLKTIGTFSKLTELRLPGTEVNDDGLVELASLKKLTLLNIGNQITNRGVPLLSSLTTLSVLNLSGNRAITASAMAHLRPLVNLKTLDLWETKVSGGLDVLGSFQYLEELFLWGTDVVDSDLAHLPILTRLRVLYLQKTQVSDAGIPDLVRCTQLCELNLTQTKVGFEGARGILALASLRKLYLSDAAVSAEEVELLKRDFGHIEIIF